MQAEWPTDFNEFDLAARRPEFRVDVIGFDQNWFPNNLGSLPCQSRMNIDRIGALGQVRGKKSGGRTKLRR